jgi:hypothetical protein
VSTATDRPTVPTGYLGGNPVASVDVWIGPETVIAMHTQSRREGVLVSTDEHEVTPGSYVGSVIKLGRGGVSIFAHREDLVRLVVVLSEHLDALDRADEVDRKVDAK